MWTVFYILVVLGCLASIANLVLLFFLVGFIVNLREKLKEFFGDLVMMVAGLDVGPPIPTVVQQTRPKTWDEKFEEELAERERRLRGESGLDDLPPPKATYNEPPAVNKEAQDGLILQENKGNMRI